PAASPACGGRLGWGRARREIGERGDLMRPPPRPSPARGGGGRVVALLAAHRRLPPLAGKGWGQCPTRNRRARRSDAAPTPALPRTRGRGACHGPSRRAPAPSPACGGRVGGGQCPTRNRRARRVDAAPTPALPRKRGRGRGSEPSRRAPAPSPACGGRLGWGRVRREIVERGDLMRPPPQPSPHAGEGACPGPFRREPVLSPACGGGACSDPSPRGAARLAGPALATRRAFGWFARQRRAGRSFPPPQVAGGACVQAG